jgi:polynucleotide 5'-hydroxyl-kinase GRC3/NOL9
MSIGGHAPRSSENSFQDSRGRHSRKFEVPSEWKEAAAEIIRSGARRVLVAGPADAGKSTFCRILLAETAAAGRTAELVDADIGQKMVGPPACVTLGTPSAAGLALRGLVFVGATDPLCGWRDVIGGTALLTAAAQAELLIVNTGGLVSGAGARLKQHKIAAVRPDIVVLAGDVPGIAPGSDLEPDMRVIRLPPSPFARHKTDGERRAARRNAFRSYFAGASERVVRLRDLDVEAVPGPGPYPPLRLLVGFADRSGRDFALGVVTGVVTGIVTEGDPAADALTCLTPADLRSAARLRCGSLLLAEDFSQTSLPR